MYDAPSGIGTDQRVRAVPRLSEGAAAGRVHIDPHAPIPLEVF